MAQESDCRYCAGKGFRDASQQLESTQMAVAYIVNV